jgi:hypothetical protein
MVQAVKLKEDNVRALYGILLTSGHLASSPKSNSVKKKECLRLVHWATERLKEVYAGDEEAASSPAAIASSATNGSSGANGGNPAGKKKKVSSPSSSISNAHPASQTSLVKSGLGDVDKREPSADVDAVEALISAFALVTSRGS